MKHFVVMLAVLMSLAGSALAQVQGGTIGGTVQDEQSAVLPGVIVTLQGVDAARETVTGADGSFRFLDLAPGPYKLTAALAGFSTIVQDGIVVAVGKAVDLRLTTKIAGITETITVSGGAPIVDIKATGTATNFTADELTKIPTSRDPFALMRTVPGVLVDRVNIGGNETGQQSNFASKGTGRRMPSGRSTASSSPIWRRRVRRRPTSTTTISRKFRSPPPDRRSSSRPGAWASTW